MIDDVWRWFAPTSRRHRYVGHRHIRQRIDTNIGEQDNGMKRRDRVGRRLTRFQRADLKPRAARSIAALPPADSIEECNYSRENTEAVPAQVHRQSPWQGGSANESRRQPVISGCVRRPEMEQSVRL